MIIKRIIGENGPMSELCTGGACPAVITTHDGNVYVQGYLPGSEASEAIKLPEGEAIIGMPLAVLKRIAAQVSEL